MKHGIKAKDALHIACAIKSGCDYFITTDRGLTNKNIDGTDDYEPNRFCEMNGGGRMKTDNVARVEAMEILIANLGVIDAERFISMVKRDTFDYTEWQHKLWEGKCIEEIHALATEYEKKQG